MLLPHKAFFFGGGGDIRSCDCIILTFGRFWECFLIYSGSISFRKLKNSKKILCLLGGVGAKIRFLSKKKLGKNVGFGKNTGSACIIYMGATVSNLNSICIELRRDNIL